MRNRTIRLIGILVAAIAALSAGTAFAADTALCLAKYKTITEQFYTYNAKSAASNAVMDRIAIYFSENQPVENIHKADAKAWRTAIEALLAVGVPFLQNLTEYKELGCKAGTPAQLDEQIQKVTEDLKYSHARLNSLVSGLPASVFR